MRSWVWGVAVLAAWPATADEPDADRTHRFPSSAVHTFERAGQPTTQHKWAVPSRSPHHAGGWVGGGRLALFPRTPDGRAAATEGTWGWDYVGLGRRPGRVFLDWWHGRPAEPAAGPYRTDGPTPPDVIALHPLKKLAEAGKPDGADK